MKKLTILIPILILLSCSSDFLELPRADEKTQLNQIERFSIPTLLDKLISDNKKIELIGNSFSHEQFELYRYLVPLLHDRQKLSMGFWFLKGNSDEEIANYLKGSPDAPDASDLLFKSNPILCGYKEYVDFLEYLKLFYSELSDTEQMYITGTDDAFISTSLYSSHSDLNNRVRLLIHSPLILESGRCQLPFAGKVYFMMVHEWPLDLYSGISVQKSALHDLFLTSDDKENQKAASTVIDYLILMGIPNTYKRFTPIESFIGESNVTDALKFFPKQIIREKVKPASYLVNKKIIRNHRRTSRRLEAEYTKILEMFPNFK